MGASKTLHNVCADCGSLLLSDVCRICGYTFVESEPADFETSEVQEVSSQPEVEPVETAPITSLFAQLNPEHKEISRKSSGVWGKRILVALLVLALGAAGGYAYWMFDKSDDSFMDPMASQVSNGMVNGESIATEDSNNERTIDLNLGLNEGNFVRYNMAQFAEPDDNIFIQMFGLKAYVDKFVTNNIFDRLTVDLKLKEDDANVYLTEKFAVVFESDSFINWGIITGVKNKEFAEEKLKLFETKKAALEKSGTSRLKADAINYTKYFARLVEIEEKNEDGSSEKQIYLLVSNSKEFLDRMKELSEGNVPNLASSAVFAQAQKDLPAVGAMSIYKGTDSPSWNNFSEWFSLQYDYVGFDKILKAIKSSNSVLYSKDEKLKIVELNDF